MNLSKMRIIQTINITFFSLLFLSSFAQEKIDFRISLEEKTCFDVKTTLLIQNFSATNKNKTDSESETNIITRYNVVKKTPVSYHLNMMYTDYFFKMTGVKTFEINPNAADMLNILDGSTQIAIVMNNPFFIELSPKGKVLRTKENKTVAKEIKHKTKKLSHELQERVNIVINSLAGNEALIEQTESWTSYIPPFAVNIGEHWLVTKDSTLTSYTFLAETDSTYIIEGIGNSKKTFNNEIQKGMVMFVDKSEDFTIHIEINKQTMLPNVISKEISALTSTEIKDFPAFSKPPTQSNCKSSA